MQQYKIQNRGVDVTFAGRLLAKTDTRKSAEQEKWTEFQIYVSEENKFVVNVVTCCADGLDTSRSFFCADMSEVLQALTHPVYRSISYRAQTCYNIARRTAIQHGLIGENDFALVLDEDSVPIALEPTAPWDDEDFDFSE